MKTDNVKIERSSGNVFADLGLPDAEGHLLKAELVMRIDEIIRRRGLKQVEAARVLGLSQPDVSRLLRGSFREYSVERLLRLLTALGRDVEIVLSEIPVRSDPAGSGSGTHDRLRVAVAECPVRLVGLNRSKRPGAEALGSLVRSVSARSAWSASTGRNVRAQKR